MFKNLFKTFQLQSYFFATICDKIPLQCNWISVMVSLLFFVAVFLKLQLSTNNKFSMTYTLVISREGGSDAVTAVPSKWVKNAWLYWFFYSIEATNNEHTYLLYHQNFGNSQKLQTAIRSRLDN